MDKHRLTQVGRAMKELGVQMIAAYSPQARGRSERSFGTWQGRLPQELRLAGISTRGGRQSLSAGAVHRGVQRRSSACRRRRKARHFGGPGRSDLNWIFRCRRSEWWPRTTRWRSGTGCGRSTRRGSATRLAGSTVTIHEHLDETVSIRYGPHVVGRFDQRGRKTDPAQRPKSAVEKAGAWKPAKTKSRFPPAPTLPWKSRTKPRDSHFPTAPTTASALPKTKAKAKTKTPRRRPKGRITLFHKADRSLIIKTGQLDLLTTPSCCLLSTQSRFPPARWG